MSLSNLKFVLSLLQNHANFRFGTLGHELINPVGFGMRRLVRIPGAKAQDMLSMFKPLRRRRRANRPYPSVGEMALICCVAALDRATGPLSARLRASLCHFSRQTQRIYGFMT